MTVRACFIASVLLLLVCPAVTQGQQAACSTSYLEESEGRLELQCGTRSFALRSDEFSVAEEDCLAPCSMMPRTVEGSCFGDCARGNPQLLLVGPGDIAYVAIRTLYAHNVNFVLFTWNLKTGATSPLGTVFASTVGSARLHGDGRLLSFACGSRGAGPDRRSDYLCLVDVNKRTSHRPEPEKLLGRVGLWGIVGTVIEVQDRSVSLEYRRYELDEPVGPVSFVRYNLDDRTQPEVLEQTAEP